MKTIKKLCEAIKTIREPKAKAFENFLEFYKDLLKEIPKEIRDKMENIGSPVRNDNEYGWYLTLKDYNYWRKNSKEGKLRIKSIKEIKEMIENKLVDLFNEEEIDEEEYEIKDILELIDSLDNKETIKKPKSEKKTKKKGK